MDLRLMLTTAVCLSTIPVASYTIYNHKINNDITFENYLVASYSNNKIEDKTIIDNNFKEELNNNIYIQEVENVEEIEVEENVEEPKKVNISMNFAGDCTLGSDSNFGYKNTFFEVADNNTYDYFFSNMQSLFANDDLTVVNLEGTFTDYMVKTPKSFNFRAPTDYANIILSGDIEAVNIANNHTKDYGEQGYNDTIETLNNYNIPFFGYDNYYIYEKDGIKIGFAGLTSISDGTIYNRIDEAINYFKSNNCNSMIFTFHWGIERSYIHNSAQENVAHYVIDNGGDLVIGHHPHVIQDIEEYKGKYIVYSLANFCFGGNTNPSDKDTFVFHIDFEYENGELINTTSKIHPASVSSVKYVNDYKPTLASGDEYYRIVNKINKYSNIKFDENGKISEN